MELDEKTKEESFKLNLGIACKEQFEALADVAQSWAEEMGYSVSNDEIVKDLERMDIVLYAKDPEDGEYVGLMTGMISYHFWIKQKIAHEHWFFVHPDKRQSGIGDVLMEAFSGWAEHLGCGGVIITPNKFGSVSPEKISASLAKRNFEYHGYQMMRRFEYVQ